MEEKINLFYETLKNIIGKANYDLWIKSIKFIFIDPENQENIKILCPNSYFKTNIKEKYLNNIKEAFKKIYSSTPFFEFIIQDFNSDEELILTPYNDQEKVIDIKTEQENFQFSINKLESKYTFEAFVVGDSNQFARSAAWAVATNIGKQFNPLFIYGGVGLGKTHLMQAIGNHVINTNMGKKVLYITTEEFTNHYINALEHHKHEEFREKFRNIDVLLIDDIQFLAGKDSTQEVFFHTFNSIHSSGGQIVLTSDKPPKDLVTLEDRLRSRFGWGLQADIQPPRFETRVAILKKLTETYNADISDESLEFIATYFKSDVREIEGAFKKILAFYLISKQKVDLNLTKTLFKEINIPETTNKNIPLSQIIEKVAKTYSLNYDNIISDSRNQPVAFVRQLAMYICKEITDLPYKHIGQQFKKDHSTVIYAYKKIQKEISTDNILIERIDKIKKEIYDNF